MSKQITIGSIHPQLRLRLVTALALLVTIGAPMATNAEDDALLALDGEWVFVEDRTEGGPVGDGQAALGAKFTLRVEKDVVIYTTSRRGDQRITLDGSVVEEKGEDDGSIARYHGVWKKEDGWLEYKLERTEPGDKDLVIKRVFRITDEGLLGYVFSNKFRKRIALYRHPEDIALPETARATIADMAWLTDVWTGSMGTSSIEERWSPPKGDAMLGVSRTVKGDKMIAFEYLRIVERDGGLVYVAQPGGKPPTEFVLAELDDKRAEFVNPRHDYPQRIVYELSEEGTLTASIGRTEGSLQSFEFTREGK